MKNSKDLKFSGASDGAISPQPIRHLTLRRLRRALFGYGVLSLFLVASPATVDSAILEEVGIFSLAHRGGSEEAPENTLAAIQNAIDHGANYIECDINRTIEGVVVCFHDKDVSRTTDGEGLLAEMTLAEVKELDAGSHFDVSFAGEAVPTLEEALLLVAQVEGVAILVDPKYPHWAEDVAAAFENTGVAADNISVWADSVWWVDDIDTLIPGIPVLLRLPSNSTIEFTMEWIEDSENLAVASGVVVQSDLTDPENFETIETIVELLRVQGLPAISGVSNLSSQWDSALDLGLRAISTQKPAGLQSYFADFQCQNLMDDDFDTQIDYPADPDCDSPRDESENATCADGLDNDRDGFADFPDDPGCDSATDTTETNPAIECDDGIDNDFDLWADSWDEGCESPEDSSEAIPEPSAALATLAALLCLGWMRRKNS